MSNLKPLDFSILRRFRFVDGSGEYSEKEVCAMTALYLVTQIAKGVTTLGEAISHDTYGWSPVSPQTSVECVSPTLTELVVNRNDTETDDKKRKKWAMAILPRLVGTNLGKAFEKRIVHFLTSVGEGYLHRKVDEKLEEFKKTRDPEDLSAAQRILEWGVEEEGLEELDFQIEQVLAFIDKERARREARRKKK